MVRTRPFGGGGIGHERKWLRSDMRWVAFFYCLASNYWRIAC